MSDDSTTKTTLERGIPTEDDWAAWPAMLRIIRSEIGKFKERERRWDEPTTIGEIATAGGYTTDYVHRLILRCGWLVDYVLDENKPMDAWIVFEDGE